MVLNTTVGSMISDSEDEDFIEPDVVIELENALNALEQAGNFSPRSKLVTFYRITGLFPHYNFSDLEENGWDAKIKLSNGLPRKPKEQFKSIW